MIIKNIEHDTGSKIKKTLFHFSISTMGIVKSLATASGNSSVI
jgi:hypothetical protein